MHHYQTARPLNTHQSDRSVQSDLSNRHYMMNMVQPWHKGFFVWAWSEGHSQLQTASQGGSKWPKGSHQKKKEAKLVWYNGSCKWLQTPCPQLCETRLGRLKFRQLSAVKVFGSAFSKFILSNFFSEKQVFSTSSLKTWVLWFFLLGFIDILRFLVKAEEFYP